LLQILRYLSDWTKPIGVFRNQFHHSITDQDVIPELFGYKQDDAKVTVAQKSSRTSILSLARGALRRKQEKFQQCMFILELLGFTLGWLRTNFRLPTETHVLAADILARGKTVGMELNELLFL
jgi:hypothetical protein